jgi:hypothetical protein
MVTWLFWRSHDCSGCPYFWDSISVPKIRSTSNSKWSSLLKSSQNSSELSCDSVRFNSISVLKSSHRTVQNSHVTMFTLILLVFRSVAKKCRTVMWPCSRFDSVSAPKCSQNSSEQLCDHVQFDVSNGSQNNSWSEQSCDRVWFDSILL